MDGVFIRLVVRFVLEADDIGARRNQLEFHFGTFDCQIEPAYAVLMGTFGNSERGVCCKQCQG